MIKKVAVFTGTRSEYGLLYWLLKDIQSDNSLDLKLLVSGMHLSPEFGCTYTQIENDGFIIDEKIEILLSSDSSVGVAKSIGLGVLGFADALDRLKPNVLIILGDRFEALAAAQTAMILKIPIIHLHGGEITEGAYDDSIRHSISKLSYLHATSTEVYRKRVIQLGESPNRVINVGAIGLDHLKRSKMLTLQEISESLNFKLSAPYFLVTYHPVTLAQEDPVESFRSLLDSLDSFLGHQIIITYPNADNGSRRIILMLEGYAKQNPNRVLAIKSLGHQRYLSTVKYADVIIGNSSSGIIEAPAFDVPTVNIGMRQKGRLAAKSVLHCEANKDSISIQIHNAINRIYKIEGEQIVNPYGAGNTSGKIIDMVKSIESNSMKVFHDIPHGDIL
jgi:UDP-N-acetylglucosamine 2-epimerase (non-hydrolysing)